MTDITTTLNRIRAHGPCPDGWGSLLKGLGKTKPDDEPLPYARIVEINGLDDALWCCQVEPHYAREWRLYAVWCARQVQDLMKDERSIAALDVAERHANGQATDEELHAAWNAALDAADEAVWDAAWAARAAGAAASDEWDSALDAARAARPARAKWAATWDAQTAEFLRIVGEE